MSKHAINEFDVFYLSYDEPQKEEFWAKIQDIIPWAQRVDGVKGFDSAHKACANASSTDRFITIDGDNVIYPEFFELELEIPDQVMVWGRPVDSKEVTFSWGARNVVNGLRYGNGGLKLWSKKFVLDMRTHENAERDEEKVDFCWDDKYIQMHNTYSDTCTNGSPFQAFRAGFREGVKMTLDRGVKATSGKIEKKIWGENYRRLLIWASVGADVENGLWSVYGTRLGIYMANIEADFDIANISDYDWFKRYFHEEILPKFPSDEALIADVQRLQTPLYRDLGMRLAFLDKQQSEFYKTVSDLHQQHPDPMLTESEAKRLFK